VVKKKTILIGACVGFSLALLAAVAIYNADDPNLPGDGAARLQLEWEYKFQSGSDANAAYAVAVDKSGGIYVAGDVGSGADWRILHLDQDGKKVWVLDFVSESVDVPFGLTLTPDGQVVSAGMVLGTESTHSLVISVSREGKENWRYESRGKERQMLRGIAADDESNLYLVGEADQKWKVLSLSPGGTLRWSYEGGEGTARSVDVDARGHVLVAGNKGRLWQVIGLNSAGKRLWQKVVEPPDRLISATAHALRLDPRSEAIVTGTQGRRQLRVEKLDPKGQRLWDYLDPKGQGAIGRAVDIDSEGNAIIVGDAGSDWLMLSLDPRGNVLWRFTYDGGGGLQNADHAYAVALHPSGDFIVAGAIHPVPLDPPALGAVSWRVARYRVVGSGRSGRN
jgi:hypothetical protein